MILFDWFKEQASGQKEKSMRFTCRTMVFMLLLTAVAFLQPAFCPNIVANQAASLIIRALAEIGFIVSIFVAFKYGMAALLPLVFCGSTIVSYSVLRALPDIEFKGKLCFMAGLCLLTNLLLMIALCCHVDRKIRHNILVTSKDKSTMYLEFQPVRSYGEFLTQTKLEKTILMETALFENFIGQLEFKRHAELQPTEEVEEIAPTAHFY